MDEFASLSKHCPMTPLLWMQYAQDTEMLMRGLYSLETSSPDSNQQLMQMQLVQAKKEALETSTGILELALSEFPGCSLLHLYYLECVADHVYQCELLHLLNAKNEIVGAQEEEHAFAKYDKLSKGFETACQQVGKGVHGNEGMIVSEIYRFYGAFLLARLSLVVKDGKTNKLETNDMDMEVENSHINQREEKALGLLHQLSTLFQQWSQTPMGEGSNDEMMEDLQWLWEEASSMFLSLHNDAGQRAKKQQLEQQQELLWKNVDSHRKKTSTLMNLLSSYENDVDVAMGNEAIMLPRYTLFPQQEQDGKVGDHNGLGSHVQALQRSNAKWDSILLGDALGTAANRFLFGLGGAETAQAFSKYASFLQRNFHEVVKKGFRVKGVDVTPLQDHLATHQISMISSLYERAVSECPAIETIWVSYIHFLRGEWIRIRAEKKQQNVDSQQQEQALSSALLTTSQRSIRNCPYSLTLFELRMTTLGLVSLSNLDPDDISSVIQEVSQLGFLNHNREAMLYLRLVAITVVKRKLLSLISLGSTAVSGNMGKDYDHVEDMNSVASNNRKNKSTAGAVIYKTLDPSSLEEAKDLLEDIRDMYDEIDSYLFKSHPKWSEGKALYWNHRATTEAYVLCPIGVALQENNDDDVKDDSQTTNDNEVIRCFEKLIKAQKPCHPDSWIAYCKYVSSSHLHYLGRGDLPTQPDGAAAVPSAIRKTRGLYHKSMSSIRKAGQGANEAMPRGMNLTPSWMGKGIQSMLSWRDYDVALSDLCREYLEFERDFGTEESVSHALTLIRSKLADFDYAAATAAVVTTLDDPENESNGKRKLETADNGSGTKINHQLEVEEDDDKEVNDRSAKKIKVKTDLKQPKKTDGVHKVRIGKMEYPAHPFTIHVSNLDKETQDMDLVDKFKVECGPVVHAKILREKVFGRGGHHFHGESKCAGLVQFEERMMVEQALQKDGELEIDGKVVKISRSHLPAVGLVPQGCHRVQPKGEGKRSKRNVLKKKSKVEDDAVGKMECGEEESGRNSNAYAEGKGHTPAKKQQVTSSSPSSLSFDVLSFKPRGVKQKPKISLGTGNHSMKK